MLPIIFTVIRFQTLESASKHGEFLGSEATMMKLKLEKIILIKVNLFGTGGGLRTDGGTMMIHRLQKIHLLRMMKM